MAQLMTLTCVSGNGPALDKPRGLATRIHGHISSEEGALLQIKPLGRGPPPSTHVGRTILFPCAARRNTQCRIPNLAPRVLLRLKTTPYACVLSLKNHWVRCPRAPLC